MPALIRRGGKFLRVGGKLSTGAECCCSNCCTLPEGAADDCALCVTFQLKLDDTDTTDQDFFDCGSMGVWFDGTNWQVYALDTASLVATDPRNTWQTFQFQFSKQEDDTVLATWTVNGVAGPDFQLATGIIESVQFGAQNAGTGGAKHRSIRNICFDSSRVTGFTFAFPPDDFDFLAGPGTSIDGNGDLRIDSDETLEDDYGSKAAHADPTCCTCPAAPGFTDAREINGFNLTYAFTANFVTAGDCPSFSSSGSHTFAFTRVDLADLVNDASLTFAASYQRVSPESHCVLRFVSFHYTPVGIRHDFGIDSGICSVILDQIGVGAESDAEDECGGGTAGMVFNDDNSSITVERCRCTADAETFTDCVTCGGEAGDECEEGSSGSRCGTTTGGLPAGAFTGLGSWMPGDATGLKGTYTAVNTVTSSGVDGDHSMTVTGTLEIF